MVQLNAHHMHIVESVCVCFFFDFAARTFFLYIIIIYVRMIISFSTKTILLHILKFIGPEEEKAICLRVCVSVFYNISPSRAAHVGC